MQKYYNKKSRSPFLIDKSNNDSSKEQSITNELRDQTLEKLIFQMDQLRRKHEQEKKDMTEAFNHQVQQKTKHFQKLENEFIQKNQLLEQLLFQEQSKTIHLTRVIQEKQKGTSDKEKETYRNKIQQLESILQESQKNNQKAPAKNKDQSNKVLMDTLNFIQQNILRTAKSKKLNISWIDYEILENDISISKDFPKSIQKLQMIFDNFFKQIQESTAHSLSPYRIQTQNQDKSANEIKKRTNIQKLVNISTQTKEIVSKTNKIQQTDINQQPIDSLQKNEKVKTLHQQTQTNFIVDKLNKQLQTVMETNDSFTQTEQIKQLQIEKNITFQKETQTLIIKQNQITQTFNCKFISTESQTDTLTRESLQQIEQQIKHQSKITEREEEDEQENFLEQNKIIQTNVDDDQESVFDCNKPDYDSVIEHHEELVDLRKECEDKTKKIKQLEIAFQQLLQDKEGFLFDNLITSKQHSLKEFITDKWTFKLKDHEAQQRYSIGIMGMDLQFIEKIIQGIFNNEFKVKLNSNDVAIQYYDKNFVENYRLDLIIKKLQYPNFYITNSQKVYEEQQFEMFWIDYIATQCNQIIYLINDQCKYDFQTINHLKKYDKKITIITFNDEQIDQFTINNNYNQDEQYQIIKVQNNKETLNQLCQQILQSEWDWEDVQEQTTLSQLQKYLQPLVDNEEFMQLQIREDGIFEVSINSDEIKQNILINFPYIQKINCQENIVEIMINAQEILEVRCFEDYILIIMQDFILLEQLGYRTELVRINNNMIVLKQF